MNPDAENFGSLRKLLALKRHEQPPPGYFNSFSNNVMARINAQEGDSESRWLLNLWHNLIHRPLLSGALGAGAFGLVMFGLLFSQGNASPTAAAAYVNPATPFGMTAVPMLDNQMVDARQEEINSTNPVTSGQPSLFGPARFGVQKASFRIGN
jgi:hypothetical protein